jgi:hypothetical protein
MDSATALKDNPQSDPKLDPKIGDKVALALDRLGIVLDPALVVGWHLPGYCLIEITAGFTSDRDFSQIGKRDWINVLALRTIDQQDYQDRLKTWQRKVERKLKAKAKRCAERG